MKIRSIIAAVAMLVGLAVSDTASATNLACVDNSGSPYCTYLGLVDEVFFNDNGRILMYFEHAEDMTQATAVNLACAVVDDAAVYQVDVGATVNAQTVGEFFFSMLLTAKSTGATVKVIMNCDQGGSFLGIKRIWLR